MPVLCKRPTPPAELRPSVPPMPPIGGGSDDDSEKEQSA